MTITPLTSQAWPKEHKGARVPHIHTLTRRPAIPIDCFAGVQKSRLHANHAHEHFIETRTPRTNTRAFTSRSTFIIEGLPNCDDSTLPSVPPPAYRPTQNTLPRATLKALLRIQTGALVLSDDRKDVLEVFLREPSAQAGDKRQYLGARVAPRRRKAKRSAEENSGRGGRGVGSSDPTTLCLSLDDSQDLDAKAGKTNQGSTGKATTLFVMQPYFSLWQRVYLL